MSLIAFFFFIVFFLISVNHGFIDRLNYGFCLISPINVASFLFFSFLSNQTELYILPLKRDCVSIFIFIFHYFWFVVN